MHENFCTFLAENYERTYGGMNFCKECWEFLNQPQRMLLIIFLKKY